MGSFTVAFSAWAVATATAPTGPTDDSAPKASPVATVEGEKVPAVRQRGASADGFRLEGSPEIEIVFGDTDRFKRHIDSFVGLSKKMTETRHRFSRHVASSVSLVSSLRGKRSCPTETLAPQYYASHLEGENFRALGAGFEREYSAIIRLDRHGDTDALTPDYRWRVNRARALYRQSLKDYKEMRVSFLDQLAAEARARGCKISELLELGRKAPRALAETPTSPAGKPQRLRRKPRGLLDTRPLPATFYVDNRDCKSIMAVLVDGALLGEVEGGARSAFQTTTGGHTLCLISEESVAQCGEPGTVRTAYFHDGWSIDLHCNQ